MTLAMVFPGMGPSRFADIGKFLLVNPHARALVTAADQRLGYPLVARLRDNDSDAYSEYAQVGFMISCLALAGWAGDELGVRCEYVTGPSFGQKPLTAFAGCLPVDDAIWMTAALARCMAEFFATEHTDVVTHSFVRTPAESLREILAELDAQGEWHEISCHVDQDFYMVSLRERNLDWLQARIRRLGGLPLYTMRPPLHVGMFGALRRKAEDEVLGTLPFADPAWPVVSDHDGSVLTTGEQVRTMLLDGIVQPMRWPGVVDRLRRLGVDTVCVAGPDSLFGRVGVTKDNFEVIAANPRLAMLARRRDPADR
jgi:[acyl-carrier-protein] S-malonyltransferase